MSLLGISVAVVSITWLLYHLRSRNWQPEDTKRSSISASADIVECDTKTPSAQVSKDGATSRDQTRSGVDSTVEQRVVEQSEEKKSLNSATIIPSPQTHPLEKNAVSNTPVSRDPPVTDNPINSIPSMMPPPPRPISVSSTNLNSSARSPVPPPKNMTTQSRNTNYPGLRPPTTASSLRVPNTTAAPGRGLSSSARTSVNLLDPMNNRTSSANTGRNKVVLSPGHSPLDWAALTKSNKNLAGVPRMQRVTPAHLAAANGRKGAPAWASWQGKIYNITPYLPFHPGGEGELMRCAGKPAEKLFLEAHPWVNWENMLGECLVGFLVSDVDEPSKLEEMD